MVQTFAAKILNFSCNRQISSIRSLAPVSKDLRKTVKFEFFNLSLNLTKSLASTMARKSDRVKKNILYQCSFCESQLDSEEELHTALFHQICFTGRYLKYISTILVDQKIKNVALENFLEQTTLKPCNF